MRKLNHRCTLSIVIAAIFVSAASQAFAQADLSKFGDYSVKTRSGYLHVHNGEQRSLLIEVAGDKVEAKTDLQNPTFVIDGELIQILFVKRASYEPTGKVATAELLETHRKWEADYLEQVLGKVATESKIEKVSGRDVMFWWFKRAKYDQEYDRDYYATTLVGDFVFGLSSPVTKGDDLTTYRKRFDAILKTLQIQDKPFDVEKIATEIRNSPPKGS